MSHHHLEYATLMRERGYRLTPQREIVLDAVWLGNGHTTFEQIATRVATVAPAISTATIYRTLDFFEELGVIVSGSILGEHIYEVAQLVPHHHLVCVQCQRCFRLNDNALEPARQRIRATTGFAVHMNHLIIEGMCAECEKTLK